MSILSYINFVLLIVNYILLPLSLFYVFILVCNMTSLNFSFFPILFNDNFYPFLNISIIQVSLYLQKEHMMVIKMLAGTDRENEGFIGINSLSIRTTHSWCYGQKMKSISIPTSLDFPSLAQLFSQLRWTPHAKDVPDGPDLANDNMDKTTKNTQRTLHPTHANKSPYIVILVSIYIYPAFYCCKPYTLAS